MSVLEVDSSNACIPISSPLYSIIPPLPSTIRGEACSSLDSYSFPNTNKHVILYGNGRLIVCRYFHVKDDDDNKSEGKEEDDIINENYKIQAFIYRGHMAQVTCARFSPSGAYVASSDVRGNLRVWSYDNEEHLCKLNLQRALGGPIRDIDWDKQNRRLCIVGDTSPSDIPCRFIHWNTGVTCGELGIHQRNRVSSCAIRKGDMKEGYNAYNVLTGGREDHSILINSNGARSGECNDIHNRGAIHSLTFSNNGLLVASVGADHTICIYTYDTDSLLQVKHKIIEGHGGSIYSCDFNYNDTLLITSSVDGTCRVWDVNNGTLKNTIDILSLQLSLSKHKEDDLKKFKGGMQIGCKYISNNNTAISISSNGRITMMISPDNANATTKILMGHQSPIAAMSLYNNILYTGDIDGIICQWDIIKGMCLQQINGVDKVHTGTITSIQYVHDCKKLISVGWDDTLRVSSSDDDTIMDIVDSIKLDYQPNLIVGGNCISAIVTAGGIVLVKDGKTVSDVISLSYEALSACIYDDKTLCVGGNDHNIYVYTINNDSNTYTIKNEHTIKGGHLRPIHSLSFSYSNDNSEYYLASADSRDICVWDFDMQTSNCTPLISKNRWCFHTQKITSLAWNPIHANIIASAGLDDSIYIWSLDKKMKRIHYPFSHRGGISGLQFFNEFLLVSVGNDGCICTWDIKDDLIKKFGMRF